MLRCLSYTFTKRYVKFPDYWKNPSRNPPTVDRLSDCAQAIFGRGWQSKCFVDRFLLLSSPVRVLRGCPPRRSREGFRRPLSCSRSPAPGVVRGPRFSPAPLFRGRRILAGTTGDTRRCRGVCNMIPVPCSPGRRGIVEREK